MRSVVVLDTSISSDNVGDEIIMDAVYDVLTDVIPDVYLFKVPTHDFLGQVSRNLLTQSDLAIVGGTNLLDSNMLSRSALWKLRILDAFKLRAVLLLGVGWRGYMGPVTRLSKTILRRILASDLEQSVRDSYSADKLRTVVPNVSNTSCVTMWKLTPEWCASLPRKRAATAVATLTYYNEDRSADRQMLELLVGSYSKVFFWSQQFHDQEYFQSLNVPGVSLLPPSLSGYTEFLENNDVDFVGTRLHGGIRAMQKGHRALIIGIDNRAMEVARDTNLPVVRRRGVTAIEEWIDGGAATEVVLPLVAINSWKAQLSTRF
jgi:polysaccharide pyruvyl transferase WcaK-like protein